MNRPQSVFLAVASVAAALAATACSAASPAVPGALSSTRAAFHRNSPTPIKLAPGGSVGTQVFPDGNTSNGGQGKAKDAIPCTTEVAQTTPFLTQLTIIVNGEQIMVPKGTGMHGESLTNKFIYHAKCFYYIHTHDHTGLIETEAPAGSPTYTVGEWFDIWGENLDSTQIAGFPGAVSVYINGVLQPGQDPRTVPLASGSTVTLVIGTPPASIPQYLFPAKYP